MDATQLLDQGWQPISSDGHVGLIGPFWTRGHHDSREFGLLAEARHCNSHLGTVHGGVLLTLADAGLGMRVVDELGAPRCATADLQVQFLSPAQPGEFLCCEAQVLRSSRSLMFMRGTIRVQERLVAAASGLWKLL